MNIISNRKGQYVLWAFCSISLVFFVGCGAIEIEEEAGLDGISNIEDDSTLDEASARRRECGDPKLKTSKTVHFSVDVDEGPGPLEVTAFALPVDRESLPSKKGVIYTWVFDGVSESGPMESHAVRQHVFTSPGVHTISLCITIGWFNWACLDVQSGHREMLVNVRPKISGVVYHDGQGIEDVVVSANNDPGGASAIADPDGNYELSVPYGWSGVITPDRQHYSFTPSDMTFANVTANIPNQDFEAIPISGSGGCVSNDDCDDGLFCNGAETCVAGSCEAGHNPCAETETCEENGDVCLECLADIDCDDDVFCNGIETCVAGSCIAGSDPCVQGATCDEEADACVAGQSGCSSNADCDDGLFCNGTESCFDGVCIAGGNPCAADEICDEDNDSCVSGEVYSFAGLPLDLRGQAPESDEVQLTVNVIPPNTSALELVMTVFDADFSDEGRLFINGQGPISLFGDSADPSFDAISVTLDPLSSDAAWYQVGQNTFTFWHDSTGGFVIEDISINFVTSSGCSSNADCNDGLFCNGSETCQAGSCVAGSYPCAVNEICNEANDQCTQSQANVYYVDGDGDQQPGFDSQALLGSINNPFSLIQGAANVVGPGDTVYIKAGTYYAPYGGYWTPVLEIVTSGAAGAPIRFQNYQNDIVILDAEAVRSTSDNGHRRGIHIGPAFDYIEIVGLVVKNAFREGILVSGENVLIENCIFEDCGLNPNNGESAGIKFDYSKFLTVRRCVTRHCYNGFGARNAEDSYIEDCLSYRNGITTSGDVLYPENANGFQTGVARAGSDRARFVRCIAFGNGDDGWDMSHNRDGTLDGCISFNQNDLNLPNGDGGGYKIGNDQNETDPLRQMRRILIRNSFAFGNRGHGVDNRDGWYGKFYSNTSYGNGGFGYGFNGDYPFARNNIGKASGIADVANSVSLAGDIDYNCWEDGSRANGEGPNSITADPQFVNPDGVIDTSWQSGYALDDVRGILPTITNIRSQVLSNFAIQPGSSCVDAGSFATFTAQAGNSTTQIPVEDDPRERFRVGDVIQIEGAGTATIQSMTGTAITTDASLTFSAGAGVHLPWNGARPDMGAVESP